MRWLTVLLEALLRWRSLPMRHLPSIIHRPAWLLLSRKRWLRTTVLLCRHSTILRRQVLDLWLTVILLLA